MLGLRIAALRRRAGLSQRELADRLGVSPSAMGMYEQGRREPSAEKLVRLAGLLDVSIDYLLTGAPCAPVDRRAVKEVAEKAMARLRAEGVTLRTPDGVSHPVDESDLYLTLAALLGD